MTEVRIQWGVAIPLRDGVELRATLYRGEDESGPQPVLLAMTPYIAQSHHASAMYFAARGLSFLAVDVRGRGNSAGEFHPIGEAPDAADVVRWVLGQSFCNGKVAMWGGSYLGYCQWAAAGEVPDLLATIVPTAAPFRGVDSPFRNNVFTPYTVQWLTIVAGRTSQEQMFVDRAYWAGRFRALFERGEAFASYDERLGTPSPIFQEWVSHPCPDAYWDRYNPSGEDYGRMMLPILTITGAYDADQLGALAHYRAHIEHAPAQAADQHHLVIGPWDHGGTGSPRTRFGGIEVGEASAIDIKALHLDWYRWVMADGPKPAFLKRRIAYYVIGAEAWRYADRLEDLTGQMRPLYLGSGGGARDLYQSGTLCDESASRGADFDSYIYDPLDVSMAALESEVDPADLVDQRLLHAARGGRLVYHSAPFREDTTLAGFFRLRLWLAIDVPDTDFHVAVHMIDPEGRAILLTADWLRARYREHARVARLVETSYPLPYDFRNFPFVARRLSKGSRLRLVVGPIDSIYWQKNYNSGGEVSHETSRDARVATVRLFHSAQFPSVLEVPIAAAS